MPNDQSVYFQNNAEKEDLQHALEHDSMLIGWFKLNASDPEARQYTYSEIPKYYVWEKFRWHRRQRGGSKIISRIYSVDPRKGELFALRLLLLHVPGVLSFEHLREVHNQPCSIFVEAAKALCLLDDEEEWGRCLTEAISYRMGPQLRQLFAFICIAGGATVSPSKLWNTYKDKLCEDLLKNHSQSAAENLALVFIKDILLPNGLTLDKLGLPSVVYVPPQTVILSIYDHVDLAKRIRQTLTIEQLNFVNSFIAAFRTKNASDRLFFIDGAAGTGKTHVYRYLFHYLKSIGRSVIACAFTGIAATLLPEGRTLHSAFKLPLNVTNESMSSLTSSGDTNSQYNFIRNLDVLIIDEASMISNVLLDCINRSLIDICKTNTDFGGKFVIFGGDFRQILPVVPKGTRADIVNSCIKRNNIWKLVRRFTFSKNMRAESGAQEFAKYILEVGNGELPSLPMAGPWSVALRNDIVMPYRENEDNILHLIHGVFGDKLTSQNVPDIAQHVILCPKNSTCHQINNRVINEILDGELTHYSFDKQLTDENEKPLDVPIEFINDELPTGYPQHDLQLKLGTIVIVLRNLSTHQGIVNSTRGIVTFLGKNVIQLKVLTGSMAGEEILLPRFEFIPDESDKLNPLRFRRRQFPSRPAFAMTINKCQGQTFKKIGIYLHEPVFTHGQLYVAFSRVSNFSSVRVLINPIANVQGLFDFIPQGPTHQTYNVVYKEVLDKQIK